MNTTFHLNHRKTYIRQWKITTTTQNQADTATPFAQTYFHGTRSDLKVGEFIDLVSILITDKIFPGNPTKSYRSTSPFKIVGEVVNCQGHQPEQVKVMKDALAKHKEQGINSLNDE